MEVSLGLIKLSKSKPRKLQVLSVEGAGRAVLAWSMNAEGCGNSLILDERRGPSKVRRLSRSEVAKLNGFDDLGLSWLKRLKGLNSLLLDFLIGSVTPLPFSQSLLSRIRIRLLMAEQRVSSEDGGWGYASGGPRRAKRSNLGMEGRFPQLDDWSVERALDVPALVQGLVRSGIQLSSRATYDSAIKWWRFWRLGRGHPLRISQEASQRHLRNKICVNLLRGVV